MIGVNVVITYTMVCLLAPVLLSAMYMLLAFQSVQKTRFLHRARPKGWSSSLAKKGGNESQRKT